MINMKSLSETTIHFAYIELIYKNVMYCRRSGFDKKRVDWHYTGECIPIEVGEPVKDQSLIDELNVFFETVKEKI